MLSKPASTATERGAPVVLGDALDAGRVTARSRDAHGREAARGREGRAPGWSARWPPARRARSGPPRRRLRRARRRSGGAVPGRDSSLSRRQWRSVRPSGETARYATVVIATPPAATRRWKATSSSLTWPPGMTPSKVAALMMRFRASAAPGGPARTPAGPWLDVVRGMRSIRCGPYLGAPIFGRAGSSRNAPVGARVENTTKLIGYKGLEAAVSPMTITQQTARRGGQRSPRSVRSRWSPTPIRARWPCSTCCGLRRRDRRACLPAAEPALTDTSLRVARAHRRPGDLGHPLAAGPGPRTARPRGLRGRPVGGRRRVSRSTTSRPTGTLARRTIGAGGGAAFGPTYVHDVVNARATYRPPASTPTLRPWLR